MSCSLARPLVGSRVTLPVALPRAAKRRASPRRALRVSGCGGCTRRDLITGLVTSATSAGGSRLDASAELSSKARAAYDASFARTMETGMADYELHMAMVKRELFRDLAGKDVLEIGMNTGPNLRYMRDARSVIGVEPNSQSFPYAQVFDPQVFDPLNRLTYEGCSLLRDPEDALRGAGFAKVEISRFVAGAADGSWLVAPIGKGSGSEMERADLDRAFERRGFLEAIEPHFLLAPTLVGRATA